MPISRLRATCADLLDRFAPRAVDGHDTPDDLALSRSVTALLQADGSREPFALFLVDTGLHDAPDLDAAAGHDLRMQTLTRIAASLPGEAIRVARTVVGVPAPVATADIAVATAAALAQAFDESFNVSGRRVRVHLSAGIVLAPQDGATAADLIRRAWLALDAARSRPFEPTVFFDERHRAAALEAALAG